MASKVEAAVESLPTINDLRKVEALETDGDYITSYESGMSKAVRIEDGGGNECTVIFNGDDILIYFYDNESDLNFFDGEEESAESQTVFNNLPERLQDALLELEEEIVWSWDDTGVIWATGAFWTTSEGWGYSAEWAEQVENSSDMNLTPLLDDLVASAQKAT